MLSTPSIFEKISQEKFLRSRRWDRLRTFAPVVHFFPLYVFALLMMKFTRIHDPDWVINRFRESTRQLLAQKSTVKNRKLANFILRMAELNDIGIDQVQTITESRILQKECFSLKKAAGSGGSQSRADEFLRMASKLYDTREHLLDVNRKKMDKQKEVVEAIERIDTISKKDLAQLAVAQAIDSALGTHIVSSAKLGDITGKYMAKQMQKGMMSPKVLNRTIQLTELCQERYLGWKSELF